MRSHGDTEGPVAPEPFRAAELDRALDIDQLPVRGLKLPFSLATRKLHGGHPSLYWRAGIPYIDRDDQGHERRPIDPTARESLGNARREAEIPRTSYA